MRRVLAVDVDLTVVDTGKAWLEWFGEKDWPRSDVPFKPGVVHYDLSDYFIEKWPWGDSFLVGHDFWRRENVYDNLSPIYSCAEELEIISKAGWDIVFVSAIKGNHHKSKYNFLKRNFPFMSGLLATKEKQYVTCHAAIDDRNHYLNRFGDNPIIMPSLYKFMTPYTQDAELKYLATSFVGWKGFAEQFLEREKNDNRCIRQS